MNFVAMRLIFLLFIMIIMFFRCSNLKKNRILLLMFDGINMLMYFFVVIFRKRILIN